MSHYPIERKRAAVEIFKCVKRLRTEHGARWLEPISLSSVASGGASRRQIYAWLKSDLSEEARETGKETRGRPRALNEDQESLLVGFAVSSRSSFQPVSLSTLKQFCHSYLSMTPSLPTLSRIMSKHNLSSQRTIGRNSRMVSEEVVEDALSAIEEIRSYNFPPHRVICMDETGLWSNVSAPTTCHFKNWNNAVVRETGDKYRDTLALTLRGDGVDIPPFIIVHTYKNASAASGRRCRAGDTPIKGMDTLRMIAYIDHISQYVQETSLLLMDRLSSHTAGAVRQHIMSKTTTTGDPMFIPIYFPAKTAFLISPLDMGAIAAFKSHYYRLDRSTIQLKLRAVHEAWDAVSNDALLNICLNCGIVGSETIDSLRQRFLKEVVGLVPAELENYLDYFDAWESGTIEVDGARRGREVTLTIPDQLPEGYLDGVYWANFGRRNSYF